MNGMTRDLSDLINDDFAVKRRTRANVASVAPPEALSSWSCKAFRTESGEFGRLLRDMPPDIMHELCLPVALEDLYTELREFVILNRHKPFVRGNAGHVAYFEYDEMQNLIRVYIGRADGLKMRLNQQSASFLVEQIYEYQLRLFSEGEKVLKVVLRNLKPEDLLSPPDRAFSDSVQPCIHFALNPYRSDSSTFSISPQFVRKRETVGQEERRYA